MYTTIFSGNNQNVFNYYEYNYYFNVEFNEANYHI